MMEREGGTTVQVRRFHRFSLFKPVKQAGFSCLVLVLSFVKTAKSFLWFEQYYHQRLMLFAKRVIRVKLRGSVYTDSLEAKFCYKFTLRLLGEK